MKEQEETLEKELNERRQAIYQIAISGYLL